MRARQGDSTTPRTAVSGTAYLVPGINFEAQREGQVRAIIPYTWYGVVYHRGTLYITLLENTTPGDIFLEPKMVVTGGVMYAVVCGPHCCRTAVVASQGDSTRFQAHLLSGKVRARVPTLTVYITSTRCISHPWSIPHQVMGFLEPNTSSPGGVIYTVVSCTHCWRTTSLASHGDRTLF